MKPTSVLTVPKRLLQPPRRGSCLSGAALCCLQNLHEQTVFFYPHGKSGFWAYIRAVRQGRIEGYALIKNRWQPFSMALAAVAAFY